VRKKVEGEILPHPLQFARAAPREYSREVGYCACAGHLAMA
jgi:hypothetical protein